MTAQAVLLLRGREQSAALASLVQRRGLTPIFWQAIDCEPLLSAPELGRIIAAFAEAHAVADSVIAVTSQHSARLVGEALADPSCHEVQVAMAKGQGLRLAAVGDATAASLERSGVSAQIVAAGSGHALASAITEHRVQHVLLPQSSIANPDLKQALNAANVQVETVNAYQTRSCEDMPHALRTSIQGGELGAIMFTSPSTVTSVLAAAGSIHPSIACVAIGHTTAAALEAAGVRVAKVAQSATSADQADALVSACSAPKVAYVEKESS